VSERWSIKSDDPLSACSDIHWEQTGGRDDWHWRSEASIQARCDATHFYVTAKLTAYNNDKIIFEQNYSDTIEREFI